MSDGLPCPYLTGYNFRVRLLPSVCCIVCVSGFLANGFIFQLLSLLTEDWLIPHRGLRFYLSRIIHGNAQLALGEEEDIQVVLAELDKLQVTWRAYQLMRSHLSHVGHDRNAVC